MAFTKTLALVASFATCLTYAQELLSDPGAVGAVPEVVFLYQDEWPTGIAVSKSGRKFSNYPPALDPTNTRYTVAELTGNSTETPYPSAEINTPPGGSINYTAYPPTGANYQDYLIGVQSVVIDGADRLWILDTGRAATENGTMVPASYGGPKLIGVDLETDQIFKTIVFTPDATPAASYLNDVRFDLNPSLTESGQGVAYITDSSSEGQNAIIVVDLGSGEAWRRLMNLPSVSASQGFVPTIWGQIVYMNGTTGMPIGNVNFGADGIAISPDGATLWYSTTGGRELYSVPTKYLLDRSPYAGLLSQGAVQYHTQKGLTDGMESDSNGLVYAGNIEDSSIVTFDPKTGVVSTFSRDPRYSWTDTFAIGADGYIYFTENQLWLGAGFQGGVDKRQKPYALFRCKLEGNATKIEQPAPGGSNSTMKLVGKEEGCVISGDISH